MFARLTFAALLLALAPAAAFAQTSAIGGTVKDTSGAVLPGVTVEASSPVLIERVRTGVTDGNCRPDPWSCSVSADREGHPWSGSPIRDRWTICPA